MKPIKTVGIASLLASTLVAGTLPVATAEPSPNNPDMSNTAEEGQGSSLSSEGGLSSEDRIRSFIAGSSQLPGSSKFSLQALLSSVGMPGSSAFKVPAGMLEPPANYPHPVDESITEVKLINREISPQSSSAERRNIERWTISSPSMGRNILVDVRPAQNLDEAAPIVVLLDGIDAPIRSGWLYGPGEEEIDETFGNENVTLVFPLDANSSWYADWVEDDPKLGRHKWETFIMEEMLPTVESAEGINFNGKRAIGGLSMGATGAVHLANTNPDKFDATFGISGCYSTSSAIGKQIITSVPESRGGSVENMFGPAGSRKWKFHDTASNPEGLRNMEVYLSTADGGIDSVPPIDEMDTQALLVGYGLEVGVNACTRDLDKSMRAKGMNHHKVHYKGDGRHNWRNFEEELQPAWDHIRPALY